MELAPPSFTPVFPPSILICLLLYCLSLPPECELQEGKDVSVWLIAKSQNLII